jgi:dTDP-L-rhamnose 4-epimerase
MAQALAKALNGQAPIVTGQYRLGDVRHITADSSRLLNELGFQPSEDFTEGMRELSRHP